MYDVEGMATVIFLVLSLVASLALSYVSLLYFSVLTENKELAYRLARRDLEEKKEDDADRLAKYFAHPPIFPDSYVSALTSTAPAWHADGSEETIGSRADTILQD
jgi:hypothetical protein